MRIIRTLTIAAAALLGVAACTKETEAPQQNNNFSREYGVPVVFGASTGYDNGPATKAEYSGETTTDGYERINWREGEKFKIFCNEASAPSEKNAVYKISGLPENQGKASKAAIEKSGETGLRWGSLPKHYFYAVSPYYETAAPGTNKVLSHNFTYGGSRLNMKVEIPSEQSADNEPVMTAITSAQKEGSSPVSLDFSPAVNTFDIELINGRSGNLNIQAVKLTSLSTDISGKYSIILFQTGQRQSSLEYGTKKTVSTKYNIELLPGQTQKIRLYTLPVDIQDLTLVIMADGKEISLEFKDKAGEWQTFQKERKYNLNKIRIPENLENFTYVFTANAPEVRFAPFSMNYPPQGDKLPLKEIKIKSHRHNDDGTKNIAVPWGYSGRYWWVNYFYSKYSYPGLQGNGTEGGEEKLVLQRKDLPKSAFDEEANQKYNRRKQDFAGKPRVDNYDLSMVNGQRNTANCYAVQQKGTYKFPLAYGNGIKNGFDNTPAFQLLDANDNILQMFVDGAGNSIEMPYFNADKVELVWEDSKGLIEKLYLQRGEDDYLQYVHFAVENNINFGNAVIAVKDSRGIIIWTWHIWVTDISFEPNQKTRFLDQPLGFRPRESSGYRELDYNLDLIQADVKGKVLTLPVKVLRAYSHTTCLYYTSGRMTPLLPTENLYYQEDGRNITTVAKSYTATFSPDGSRLKTQDFRMKKADGNKTIDEAISSPGLICGLQNRYWNLWDNSFTSLANEEGTPSAAPIKTIYDPSPAGYRLPSKQELRQMKDDITAYWKMGGYAECVNTSEGHLDIPVRDFAQRGYFHANWGSLAYPESGNYEPVVHIPIFSIQE